MGRVRERDRGGESGERERVRERERKRREHFLPKFTKGFTMCNTYKFVL